MIFNQTELVTLVLPDQSEATTPPLDSSNHRHRVNLLIVIEVIRTTCLHFSISSPFAGAEKQQEIPSSSRKRKSKDEMSSGKETTGPSILIASLENEPSEKKNCYEIGGSS
jgi:hypothetical protein